MQDEFHRAARERRGVDAVTVERSVLLNVERNRLMGEIDRCVDGERPPRVKLT